MHAFLICSRNKKTAMDYAATFCKNNGIATIDIDLRSYEKMVGVEDVRTLKKNLILKPIESKTKAAILEGHNGLTIEAQNALLKILEEPPAHTIIILTTPNKDLMLPTILSRCKIIELKEKSYDLSEDETTQYFNILISMLEGRVGEKLKLAQDVSKNKEDAIPWLEKMILVARQKLINSICHPEPFDSAQGKLREGSPYVLYKASWDSSSRPVGTQNDSLFQYLNILISLQKTQTVLKTTNVNPRLALENLFLNL